MCRGGSAHIGRMVAPRAEVASEGGLILLCNQIDVTLRKETTISDSEVIANQST